MVRPLPRLGFELSGSLGVIVSMKRRILVQSGCGHQCGRGLLPGFVDTRFVNLWKPRAVHSEPPELELLMSQADSPIPVFPTTRLHVEAAVEASWPRSETHDAPQGASDAVSVRATGWLASQRRGSRE